MTIAFYKVDNKQGYERHTFDTMSADEIRAKLNALTDEELKCYDLSTPLTTDEMVEDYNDEVLDGGWWCVLIEDKPMSFDEKKKHELHQLKQSILEEIHNQISDGREYELSSPYTIHFLDGDMSTKVDCIKVGNDTDGNLYFVTRSEEGNEEYTDKSHTLYFYDTDSLLAILDAVRYEVKWDRRNLILAELKAMCKENGGAMRFDGKFRFTGMTHFEDGSTFEHDQCYLNGIEVENNELIFCNTEEKDHYNNLDEFIEDSELERIFVYARKNQKIGKIQKYLSGLGSGVGDLVLQLDGEFECKGIKDDAGNWFADGGHITEVYMYHEKVYVTQDRDDNKNQGLLCPLENMDSDTLERFCQYFENQKKQTFTIKVFASRTWEIPADSAEEALQMAQADLKSHPLYDGDIDGWE